MGMIAFIPQGIYCAVSGDIPVVTGRGGDAADMQWAETRSDDRRHPPGKGQPRHRGISSPGHHWYLGEKRGEVSQCSASPSCFVSFGPDVMNCVEIVLLENSVPILTKRTQSYA